MDSDPDWRGSLSFSDRFANISKIAAVLEKPPDTSRVDARQQAKDVEKNIYIEASSLEEYHLKCGGAAEPSIPSQEGDRSEDDEIYDPQPSDVSVGKYTNATHFRDGLFSFVYRARSPSDSPSSPGEIVALKVTTPSMMENPHDSEREARILASFRHSNVIPMIDLFRQPGGQLVLVFPFLPYDLHGVVQDKMARRDQLKSHLRDLFAALQFIHSHGCIHRDIKPANILLKSPAGPAYLADFGIAWSSTDIASEPHSEKITDVGTTCYRPPELLFGNKSYDHTLDLWAAGCTVAEADGLHGRTLFDSGDLGSELALIQSIFSSLGTPTSETWPEATKFPDWGKMAFRQYPPKTWEELLPAATPSSRSLVKDLVKFESGQRLSASHVLNHPYFAEASA